MYEISLCQSALNIYRCAHLIFSCKPKRKIRNKGNKEKGGRVEKKGRAEAEISRVIIKNLTQNKQQQKTGKEREQSEIDIFKILARVSKTEREGEGERVGEHIKNGLIKLHFDKKKATVGRNGA